MYVRNVDWPDACIEKIGIRMQVNTVAITDFVNVTVVAEKDKKNSAGPSAEWNQKGKRML
jgi:hypothetical protein